MLSCTTRHSLRRVIQRSYSSCPFSSLFFSSLFFSFPFLLRPFVKNKTQNGRRELPLFSFLIAYRSSAAPQFAFAFALQFASLFFSSLPSLFTDTATATATTERILTDLHQLPSTRSRSHQWLLRTPWHSRIQ